MDQFFLAQKFQMIFLWKHKLKLKRYRSFSVFKYSEFATNHNSEDKKGINSFISSPKSFFYNFT